MKNVLPVRIECKKLQRQKTPRLFKQLRDHIHHKQLVLLSEQTSHHGIMFDPMKCA